MPEYIKFNPVILLFAAMVVAPDIGPVFNVRLDAEKDCVRSPAILAKPV